MLIIKYKFLACEANWGTEENPDIHQVFLDKSMPWSEANEAIAKTEAHNGEYTIEEDEQIVMPQSPEERIAELEEALEMLLSGVTE